MCRSAKSTSTPWCATPRARRCRRPAATRLPRWWSPRSTAPTPSAWPCCWGPRRAPISCSPKRAWKVRAPSPTRSGTPRASCSDLEKYGTDAIRMALLLGAAQGTDIVLTEARMESTRAFANKIWNAARFLFLNMERCGVDPWVPDSLEEYLPGPDAPIEDRWIFSRLNHCAGEVNRAIETYRYHEAAQVLWHFIWHEFCDWYVELKKLRFQEGSGLTDGWRNTLAAFEGAMRLLHPAMPFLTEELWQRLR